jgi:ACS family hexuronate transporter-like MFS transporter
LLWIGPWWIIYRKPPGEHMQERKPSGGFGFFYKRQAWGIILARFFADSIWYFYVFWLPDYLSHVQSLSLRAIGATAWIPFLAAGIGNFAGGAASGYLIRVRCNVVRSRLTVMGASALVMTFGAGIRYCHIPILAIALISVIVFAYSAWAANVLTLPSDVFPPAMVATVAGASGTAAGLGGMMTTYLAGRVIDRYSYAPVFIGLGCLPIFAFACSLLVVGTVKSGERGRSSSHLEAEK